jgi:hypothetical protein
MLSSGITGYNLIPLIPFLGKCLGKEPVSSAMRRCVLARDRAQAKRLQIRT